jgi:hypothetical protein
VQSQHVSSRFVFHHPLLADGHVPARELQTRRQSAHKQTHTETGTRKRHARKRAKAAREQEQRQHDEDKKKSTNLFFFPWQQHFLRFVFHHPLLADGHVPARELQTKRQPAHKQTHTETGTRK